MITYAVAVVCVLGIAVGQILFKLSATELQRAGTWFDPKGASILLTALVLYGVTTIGWVWVLQKADLGKVYPLMAMAFVIVPVGSYFMFGERFSIQYFVGVLLIAVGIVITVRA